MGKTKYCKHVKDLLLFLEREKLSVSNVYEAFTMIKEVKVICHKCEKVFMLYKEWKGDIND